jgi:hypothetical protein
VLHGAHNLRVDDEGMTERERQPILQVEPVVGLRD